MRKLLLKLALFLPLLLSLLIIQRLAYSSTLFNTAEAAISKAWLNEENVAFTFDYDDRVTHKYYIKNNNRKKDAVIFGSSRSAKINNSFFPKKSFFNHNVTGAELEDYMSIYQLYRAQKNTPATVVLGLDPWILDSKNGKPKRWLDLHKEFYELAGAFPFPRDPKIALWYLSERLKAPFSIPHLQYSIKKIAQNILLGRDHSKYYATSDSEGFLPIVHADGSIADSLKIRSKSSEQVALEIQALPSKCPTVLKNTLSKEKQFLFINFLKILKEDNVNIIFLLPPFHPLAYNEITSNPRCHLSIEAEAYFRDIAQENNIQILGSYNPNIYGLHDAYFYDSIHPKQAAWEIIFRKEMLIK